LTICNDESLPARDPGSDEYGLWPGTPRWLLEGLARRAARVASDAPGAVGDGLFGVDMDVDKQNKWAKKRRYGLLLRDGR